MLGERNGTGPGAAAASASLAAAEPEGALKSGYLSSGMSSKVESIGVLLGTGLVGLAAASADPDVSSAEKPILLEELSY